MASQLRLWVVTTLTASFGSYVKNWPWSNYLSAQALTQAENVREQLKRTMERFEVELVSVQDQKKLYVAVRQALCCAFFVQVAHKEGGDNGRCSMVKDNQVDGDILIPLSGDIRPYTLQVLMKRRS